MRRMHSMPFGAQYAEGATRFALWAPACESVHLAIGRENVRTIAMQPQDGGWHRCEVSDLAPGTAYAFAVDGGAAVPDPASRSNPWDVGGPSAIVDPRAFEWPDDAWQGRPWHEAVLYELHIGTFTRRGTFASAIERLDHLADTGITAIEVMPVADFPGARSWGYDGVLPFAPDSSYGTPEDFKRFVAAAHARGLMVLLDVVYNHFGPEGNHLSRYAPQFFNEARHTPWGAAINFDADHSGTVREFFVHNALYWIEEFHLDGLRLDAVHAMRDESPRHVVREIARAIADGPAGSRHVHLVIENEHNAASLLDPSRGEPHATAQWADDFHHAAHVLVTGESDGYYVDFADRPAWYLARALAEGFAYQGERSALRKGATRGEPSAHLAFAAFILFLQNHDQVGNRALGERLATLAPEAALRLAAATLLLAPEVPMLFMGEEFGSRTPFLYFCDFHGGLADAVREGRRREFATFERFAAEAARSEIPDPNAPATFESSKLRWEDLAGPAHAQWLAFHRALLALRRDYLVPRLGEHHRSVRFAARIASLIVDWTLGDGATLHLRANFSSAPASDLALAPGALLHAEGECGVHGFGPWAGAWTLETP